MSLFRWSPIMPIKIIKIKLTTLKAVLILFFCPESGRKNFIPAWL